MKLLRYPFITASAPTATKKTTNYDPYSEENMPLFKRAFQSSTDNTDCEYSLDTSTWD